MRAFLGLGLALGVLLAGCTGTPPPQEPFDGIGMRGVEFVPQVYNATVGTKVVWRNTGELMHTVTAADGSFDSGPLLPGQPFERTFPTEGSVAYYCKPHASQGAGGAWQGMVGTVVVRAA